MDQEIFGLIRNWEEKSIKDKSEFINQLGDIQKEIVWREKKIEKLKMMIKQLKEGVQEDKNDKVSESSKSEKCAELILPPEVWETILEKVSDPLDLYNCNKTCKLFQRILLPTKTAWLFGTALPLLYKHLDRKSIFAVRSVCRTISVGIDNLTNENNHLVSQSNGFFRYSNRERHYIPNPNPYFKCFDFVKYEDKGRYFIGVVNKLFEKMKGHPRNPFIGRTFHINNCGPQWGDDEDDGDFWTPVYNFLKTFGKHFWHVYVEQGGFGYPDPPLAHRFFTKDMFELLPNLRSISYAIDSDRCYENKYHGDNGEPVVAEYLDALTFVLRTETFHLQRQHFLKSWIATYHNSLKKLQIPPLPKDQWTSISSLEWGSLLELEVYNIMDNPSLEAVTDIKAPTLKKLALSLGHASEPWHFRDAFPLEALVEIANKFCCEGNLSDLTIGGIAFVISRKLEFRASAKLKKLTIDTEPLPFTFLLCFPGLKELVLTSKVIGKPIPRKEMEMEKDKVMELHKYHKCGGIYKSNIWKFLPHLESLTIESSVYTRFGYECFNRRQEK